MKKLYFIFSVAVVATVANAQTPVVDSIQSGPSYVNEVYYSLKNGNASEDTASKWQIAFSIGSFNVAARINSASSANAVTLYQSPETDTSKWSNFDTANYTTWTQHLNSTDIWEDGAFNMGGNESTGDYGWGQYAGPPTHGVNGHRMYLVKYGSSFKRVFIKSKVSGNWVIYISDIDGSNSKTIAINSSTYSTKNFVYMGLDNGDVLDIEPAKNAWDFVLTRYHADLGGGTTYPSYGILTNEGVKVAEVRGKDPMATTLADTLTNTFSSSISTIGHDWKNMMLDAVTDTLSYFVKSVSGGIYKLVFTYIESGSTASGKDGKVIFTKTQLTANTGIANVSGSIKTFEVYPNPASGSVNVVLDADKNTGISIVDLAGKIVRTLQTDAGFTATPVDLSGLSRGIYFITVSNEDGVSTKKLVVE